MENVDIHKILGLVVALVIVMGILVVGVVLLDAMNGTESLRQAFNLANGK